MVLLWLKFPPVTAGLNGVSAIFGGVKVKTGGNAGQIDEARKGLMRAEKRKRREDQEKKPFFPSKRGA
jgi:hypothetical protein